MTVKNFLKKAKNDLRRHKFSYYFIHRSSIICPDKRIVNAYIDYDDKEIFIATKHLTKIWFSSFVHEYSHFRQLIETPKIVIKLEYLWNWIEGEDIPMHKVRRSLKQVQYEEWDCERRTIQTIKENNLPININWYTQKANLCLLTYNTLLHSRDWNAHISWYTPSNIKKMPKRLIEFKDIQKAKLYEQL